MTDAERYKELLERAAEWWVRVGHYGNSRGSFMCSLPTGGTFDIRELIADFVLQLPYQEEAAILSRPDMARLHKIAQHLWTHDPWKRAFEEHMATCPGPPVLLYKNCPHCGMDFESGKITGTTL